MKSSLSKCNVDEYKPIEYTTPRVDPNVKYGFWVVMMSQRRIINCNKYTAECIWGQRIYGKPATSIQCFCELIVTLESAIC